MYAYVSIHVICRDNVLGPVVNGENVNCSSKYSI